MVGKAYTGTGSLQPGNRINCHFGHLHQRVSTFVGFKGPQALSKGWRSIVVIMYIKRYWVTDLERLAAYMLRSGRINIVLGTENVSGDPVVQPLGLPGLLTPAALRPAPVVCPGHSWIWSSFALSPKRSGATGGGPDERSPGLDPAPAPFPNDISLMRSWLGNSA
ncbi:hypothetical protein MGG_16279 [Pyricularia oryzae 70-15]|uniref:Uncharacterized protein n=1 Tax=Pyricularia oryzae (strain 70-15 / ATCC MYA-4617 / FGSC 8958) TaxID=242507 RepID=G4MQR0_PYRO7|nr:uncharacterized protein MGG_16279 [Pyricularia oryzae 70-15]EHA57347.1 hypothetical protein MGG_16279 [Pyricularia oryzae 70-15]